MPEEALKRLPIDPIKLCCMRRASEHNGALCPDGTFMCCVCFEKFPESEALVDHEGRWDVCPSCAPKVR